MITTHIYNFFIIMIIMGVVDFFYLSSMSKFFNSMISNIQGKPINLLLMPTFVVYIFLVFQLYFFVIMNINKYDSLYKVILQSFLLGLTTYGVFEFTNKALFNKWNYTAVILDTFWGGILFSLTTLFYYYLRL